ncbi:lantibiotic dehydratase [Nonomuraea sp. MG754425]|uniref:lantibiotic dehydratase n=1 Tax=Nonomuraea sp. MG754425 TaxID=2570319 RepID=UPI001F2D2FDE|nr:lantibiotic dehydratase [Nonomuraea sp. MG754425]
MSASALLRVAGLPVRLWLAAASPGLSDCLRTLNRTHDDHRAAAAGLAVRLGDEVVPRPELTAGARRLVLSARRRLHQGLALSPGETARLREILASSALAALLDRVTSLSGATARLEELARERAGKERDRLLATPWHLLHSVPGGLSCAPPEVVADIERRLAAGEPWTSKRLRRRSDYLWRMIDRGGVKTTPRAWLGHVSLVPVAGPGAGLSVTGQVAVDWTENVHDSRREHAARAAEPGPEHLVSLTPLHRVEGDRLAIWTTDRACETQRLVTSRLRLSPALASLVKALRSGARPVSELDAPSSFTAGLVRLGVLEVSAPLRQRPARWGDRGGQDAGSGSGFVDVYRRADGALTADLAALQHAFEQYRRINRLIEDDSPRPPARTRERIGARPRPVMDVFAEELAARVEEGELTRRHPREHTWPLPGRAGSGYARLLDLMAAAAGSAPVIDLTAELLDAVGAPDAPITWPTDCVLRPLPSGGWVLDNAGPAGVLDARFVETLRRLHGTVPAADAYRAFLAELDRLTGVPSVELLIPPLAVRAANAIRRPRYTSAWTGDPDPRHYGPAWRPGSARHLPLNELTAHREADRVVIAHAGRPVRICTHATRNPLMPWPVLTGILCAGSPQHHAPPRRLRRSLTAFPGRDFVPRITVAGCLVISPAQWRVPAGPLGLAARGDLAGLRELTALRERLGLPRWVFVAGPSGNRPLACDLESLRAVRAFEQAMRTLTEDEPPELTITEMAPAADELSVRDHDAERVAAEVLVRLPHAVAPEALAATAAQISAGTT